jgi:murein DD-endopeptidase MepM/ murein hydrolase activator NlpD
VGSSLRRRLRRLVPLLAVVAAVGAYSQWVLLPRAPGWIAPTLAAGGAAFVTWSFLDALRRRDGSGSRRLVRVSVNVAALVVFVVLPASRLVMLLRPMPPNEARVLSGFRDWIGAEGFPRVDGLHSGVDVAGPAGGDVLAAGPGRVLLARDNRNSCGLIVVIDHGIDDYRTVYCHLAELSVKAGDTIARGARIGAIGTSGMRAWPGYQHVHLELEKGSFGPREDPLARTVGCFRPGAAYPPGLTLTYPVAC